ncbi:MAG: response regulator [Mogibacterium sp.]|nr:response regulator [Mogibacterium sp.]
MAIVKELMDMFGGTVEIDSAEGKGTTVTLTFPLQQAEKMESIEEELIEDEDVSLDGVKVLLVEDNELNREIAAEMLREFGCEVVEAVDGQEAVDKYTVSEIGEFDIVFMDIMMPNLNGYEATNEIRSSVRSDAKTIPIVALSANAFAEDVEKSREAGMNEHLSKPIEPDRLLAVIKHMVHKQK